MPSVIRAVLLGIALLGAAVFALDRAFPPDLSQLAQEGTEFLARDGRTLAMVPAAGGVWRFRTRADDVAPVLLDTLIATEDRYFLTHPGVNPLALLRAGWQDLRAGRIVSGGSTITMQAARLLEPRPRTLRSKLIEVLRAVQLEARFSKREILGIWLSLAPMGGNLEGVRAGSLAWFGVPPRLLEAEQAALLVAIPRRPEALRPDRHAARATLLRDRILAASGRIAANPVPVARTQLPRQARLALTGLAHGGTQTTTLSRPLQEAIERLAGTALGALPERASVAIIVADAATRDVLAIASGSGTLDLTRAIRSPGSALKPFIYGMAFEAGIAGPGTVMSDMPRRFGTYAPENFDRGFDGSVTAADALRRSLNLPAVALLDRVGPLRFAAGLRAAGVPLRLPPHANPSLPLALGGAGIDLRHMVALYAALATDGSVAPLRLLERQPSVFHPLLAPRAAADVAAVMTQNFPERGPAGIAWKTGTSWGGRDAWALGFNRRLVVGVWVGRADGTALPGATGRALALPLLAQIFDLLPPAPRDPPPRFAPEARGALHADTADALRLLFPPPGAVLSNDGPVTLRAMGGRRPLAFLVDGAPIMADAARRQASWLPPGPGFYRVTVLDADGSATRVGVRVK